MPKITGHQLHKATVRRALAPRREPYWGPPIARYQHLGLRKLASGGGMWIARMLLDGQQVYKSLGRATESFGPDQASAAAIAWFALKVSGIANSAGITVAKACELYVADRRREKNDACAHDADKRFERTVYEHALGRIELARLRAAHLKSWREGLGLSKSASNRTLVALKAALNLAVRDRLVSAAQVQEWRDVKAFKNAGKRRDLYLDLKQRQALLTHSEGAIRDLLEAVMVTGARAGELVNALRRQFDARTGTLMLTGKTGPRTVPLAPAAVTLFTRLSKSKLPSARLLVRDDGKAWAHSDWDELVREAADKAQLPKGACLYTLRHSFITTALSSGMSTLDVARLVGTSLQMIDKHYGHLVSSAARERLALVAFT